MSRGSPRLPEYLAHILQAIIHRGECRRSYRKQQDFVGAMVSIAIPVCIRGEFRHRLR